MLTNFAENIWIAEYPLKFFGAEIGTRMTIIDYSGNGDLLIHSPILISEDLEKAINKVGTVRFVVAPNRFHHLFVPQVKSRFPEAKLLCAPGLEKKRTDIVFDEVIRDDAHFPWSKTLKHKVVQGVPIFNEVVFFHEQSRSLIVTDVGLHICEDSPFFTRLLFKFMGNFKKFGWANLEHKIFIKDRQAFNQSIEKILAWDFDNILLAHGQLIRSGGKLQFQQAFART